MEYTGIKSIEVGWWRAYRIFMAEKLPERLDVQFLRRLLSVIEGKRLSLELIFMNGGEVGKTDLLLVLRGIENSEAKAYELIKRNGDVILNRLAEAGFFVKETDTGCAEAAFAESVFSGELMRSTEKMAASSFDHLDEKGQLFVPCLLASCQDMAFPWEKALYAIAHHSRSLLSVLFSSDSLDSADAKLLAANESYYYNSRSQRPETEWCCNTFHYLRSLIGRPLFHISCTAAGDHAFSQDISIVFAESGFRSFSLGSEIAPFTQWAYSAGAALSIMTDLKAFGAAGKQVWEKWMRYSRLALIDDAAAVFSLPEKLEIVPGLAICKLNMAGTSVPPTLLVRDGLPIGKMQSSGKMVSADPGFLCRHGIVAGKSGTGKTTYAMGLLYELYLKKIPFLAIEPVKTEYRALKDVIPELKIYTPGLDSACPMPLNPFLPPKGVTVREYLPVLNTILESAFNMNSPLNLIFPRAIRRAYSVYGWKESDTRDSQGPVHFGMRELISVYTQEVKNGAYDERESKPNLIAAGVNRLSSLIMQNPVIFDTTEAIDYETLLNGPCLIELNALTNNTERAIVLSILLQNLTLTIMHRKKNSDGLSNLVYIDEAHMMLDQRDLRNAEGVPDTGKSNVQNLLNMIRIFRTYGVGMLFADQNLKSLTEGIVGQVNYKLLLGLDSVSDREILKGTTGLTNAEIEALGNFAPGEALLCCAETKEPIYLSLPNYKKLLKLRSNVPDSELKCENDMAEPYAACRDHGLCGGKCDFSTRFLAGDIALSVCREKKLMDIISKCASGEEKTQTARTYIDQILPPLITDAAARFRVTMTEKLERCLRIRLMLEYMADEKTAVIPEKELKKLFLES